MPIIKSAIKRMRQTIVRRARNLKTKRNVRTAVKDFSAEKTAAALSKAHSELDKAVKKHILNKNTAARRKAQLAREAKEAGAKLASTAKKTVTKTTKAVGEKKPAAGKKVVANKKTPAKK